MALAPRQRIPHDFICIDYALNAAAERGGLVCTSSTAGEVEYRTAPTGSTQPTPVGVLLDDVESLNFDRHGEYLNRNVVDVGSTVTIARKGEVSTNLVSGSPSQGQKAYLAASGYFSATQASDGLGNTAPQVGHFVTAKNSAGYAVVYVDL